MTGLFDDIPSTSGTTSTQSSNLFDDIPAASDPLPQVSAGFEEQKPEVSMESPEKSRTFGDKIKQAGKSFLAGIAQGGVVQPAQAIEQGVGKVADKLIPSFIQSPETRKVDPAQDPLKQAGTFLSQEQQKSPIAGTVGEVAGAIIGPGKAATLASRAPQAAVKGAIGATRLGSAAAGATGGAVGGATFGALTPGDDVEQAKTTGLLTGAGAALGGIGGAIFKGATAAQKAAQRNLVKASEKTGIPLTVGRVSTSKTVQKAQSILEKAPLIGMGGKLARNTAKLDNALKSFVKDTATTSRRMTTQENRILTGFAKAAETVNKDISKRFNELLKKTKGQTFELARTKSTAQGLLKQLETTGKGLGIQYKKAYKDALSGISNLIQKTDLKGAHMARRNVDVMIEALKKGAATNGIVKSQVGTLKRLRHIMEREIEKHATRLGVKSEYQQVKQLHKTQMLPFRNLGLEKLDDTVLGGIVKKLTGVAEVHPESVKTMVSHMTPMARKEITNGVLAMLYKRQLIPQKASKERLSLKKLTRVNDCLVSRCPSNRSNFQLDYVGWPTRFMDVLNCRVLVM